MQSPTSDSVLAVLPKKRLIELGRDVSLGLPAQAAKDQQIRLLVRSGRLRFRELMRRLGRDELKAACRAHGLDDQGRARPQLAARLLAAHSGVESSPPAPLFSANQAPRYAPRAGDIALCRSRQWLVEDVQAPMQPGESTRVRMVCLDDDNQGSLLEVLWELELGARVHRPEAHGLGAITRIDPPRHFAAYLHALKWNSVTATDARLFQSPLRAGIKLFDHQLVPLKKALSLPRANLFIADDVGLGKTIEAGLVLSELLLRQKVEFALVICPAAVCLQWRDELEKRFGLRFELMTREFVARRRQERGFGVNPWATHHRFIVSHQLVRRPEYRDPLLAHIGERARKSLLILDEAHIAAPASASKYAVDSRVTRVLRDIAPRFENRLFLSATPHNGHSNSFAALLEILDPQRFTRGVPVTGESQLEPVMVRRLKRDLREIGHESFPLRKVIQLGLTHDGQRWGVRARTWDAERKAYQDGNAMDLGTAEPFELGLARDLARYTELQKPKSGRGRLVFINLQKRLLSSVEAFARTLQVHARSLERGPPAAPAASAQDDLDTGDDAQGPDDDELEAWSAAQVEADSRELATPQAEARRLLEQLLRDVERHRHAPDAKLRCLLDWIRRHQCAGARRPGAPSSRPPASGQRRPASAWSDKRLLIFTEYGDTKRYLFQSLSAAIANTEAGESRILQFHGGMSDEQREHVQRAFNGPPDRHPVRILIATDAAREGVNLQGHCADLVHFDVPWNPARMEQRNGRIDRTLQREPVVRCSYFVYPQRAEDPVLATVVEKVDIITRELGSLGAVVMERVADTLERDGIAPATATRLEAALETDSRGTVQHELESARATQAKLRAELEDAGEILQRSRKVLEFDHVLLRDALDVGFEWSGAGPLQPTHAPDGSEAWTLPALPDSWAQTLDTVRPPRERDETPWDWRKRPTLPVVFQPPAGFGDDVVHLHLQHPLVQRVLGRFLAQGFSMADLSRVTVVRNRHDALVRVIAFGRLSLFGAGAARLHDQLISMAARWFEGRDQRLQPFAEEADRKAIDRLETLLAESPGLGGVPKGVLTRIQAAAPALFAELWPAVRDEADARATDAISQLRQRGRTEADALRDILTRQREGIERELNKQLPLDFSDDEHEQRAQLAQDRKHWTARLQSLRLELEHEPRQVEALYQVALHRLEPVGLVVLWPETRG